MRIQYRKRNSNVWKDIPNYNNIIPINDVADDSFDNAKIEFYIAENDPNFNELRNLKPKTYIKITSTDDENDIDNRNTFYFITTKLPKGKIRNEVRDSSNNVITPELWQIEITCMELIKSLDDKNMPNYTITQPKTQFFNRFRRRLVDVYNFSNQKVSYNTTGSIYLSSTSKSTDGGNNYSGIISTNNTSGKLISRLNNIDTTGYTIKLTYDSRRTASYRPSGLGTTIYAKDIDENPTGFGGSDLQFRFTIKKYDSGDNLLSTTTERVDMEGYVSETEIPVDGIIIIGLGSLNSRNVEMFIEKNSNVSYVIVEIEPIKKYAVRNVYNNNGTFSPMPTSIPGFTEDIYVKEEISRIELDILSTQISTLNPNDDKYTLLSFVEKALYDYNFNRRTKLTLSDDAKVLLDIYAKESEWSGYNFRELLVRAFKYVNALPYLTIDNKITFIKPTETSYVLEIDDLEEKNENINDEDFYDTVVSTAKNLVSDDDFTKETVGLGSGSDEFSQITDSNATFTYNNAIYYISKAILYAPGLTFSIPTIGLGNIDVSSNIFNDGYWDITERLLDDKLYKSLPNVNFSSRVGRTSSELSQANTISFTSGSRDVSRITHRGSNIPSYNPLSNSPQTITQYAIIEALICLAYEHIMEEQGLITTNFSETYNPSGFDFNSIIGMRLELTFVPYHKEITTKYLSENSDRSGLNYEKQVSISDKSIDYKENENILRNEMDKKGNTTITITKKYESLSEVIPASSIINNGQYVVRASRITMMDNLVECEYTLDKFLLNQNNDIGLSVEYSPYEVPYEYVQREIFIDNHLLFSRTFNSEYLTDVKSCNLALLQDIFTETATTNLNKEIYSKVVIKHSDNSERTIRVKMNKITGKSSMILGGGFVDNYSAGNQRFMNEVSGSYLWYSQPYRYTDYRGKVKEVKNIDIGYTPNVRFNINDSYNVDTFPIDSYTNSRKLYNSSEVIGLDKDSREALYFNYHTYLRTIDDNVRFYNFMTINAIGTLNDANSVNLTDDLDLDKISYKYYDGVVPTVSIINPVDNNFVMEIYINPALYPNPDQAQLSQGIVLLNKTGNTITLVGIIKNPILELTSTTLNIFATRYGKK